MAAMLSLKRQNEFREMYRAQNPDWRPATEVFAQTVRDALRPASCVLDLGCGRGGLVEQLDFPLSQMVGVDPDWQSLLEHRLELPRCAALTALPFVAGRFDVVYASWVLEHWPDPEENLREIGRILAPNGRFIFITPNKRAPLIRLNQIIGSAETLQKKLVTQLYARAEADTFPVHYRANDAATLDRLAQASGLALISLAQIPDPTYLAFNQTIFKQMVAIEPLIAQNKKIHLVGCMQKSAAKGTFPQVQINT